MDRKPFSRGGQAMSFGPEYFKAQALKSSENHLKRAATFVALNIKNPLFQRRMGKGSASVFVRLEWPGVLSVVDPDTGELLAQSAPGRPDVLRPGFMPPVPALGAAGGHSQGGHDGQPAL